MDSWLAGVQSVQRKTGRVLDDLTGEPTKRDIVRATTVASRYAESTEALGQDIAKLERIIITESSEAFNAGVTRAARDVEDQTGVRLWRVWDATLDNVTCSVCALLDGDRVRVWETFSGGAEPGAVHPRCRCTVRIVSE